MYRSDNLFLVMQVPGMFELKGHERLRRLSELYAAEGIQFMPHQQRDVTYVSRLQVSLGIIIITMCMMFTSWPSHHSQSVQAAVDKQLTILFSNTPSQRVALIAFNNEVI